MTCVKGVCEMATLWEETFKRRDQQRQEIEQAEKVVAFDKLPWEINQQGKIKWYLHPALHPTAMSSLTVYVQEIPPGSRSGKLLHQGGKIIFVWAGRGYTVINDKRYDWKKDDVVVLPIFPDGITFQHFNADPENPARLLVASPNLDEVLGVDMGCGLEQLENAPEYQG
jgi:gentisate 1,2-dioxygenase